MNVKAKETDKSLVLKIVSLVMTAVLLISTVIALVIKNKNSTAYLYDEQGMSVSYSVAQLSFDLSSNHMYSYYSADDNYVYNTAFETMLNELNNEITGFENGTISISDLNIAIKASMDGYYSTDFISALQTAWDENTSSQSAYDDATRAIYNQYFNQYSYLFKIKSFQISAVESDKSIWYYYAKDLVSTYYGEYIVQENTTGVKQSSIRIGVKLKGGTTYSSFPGGTYYDEHFNEMVSGFTMNFRNTGNVGLYLNFIVNIKQAENADNGIIGMLLPYGTTLESLRLNQAYYNESTGAYNYHQIIKDYLEERSSYYISSVMSVSCDDSADTYGTLQYSSLQELINEWNTYAIGTYQNNSDLNEEKNFSVVPEGSTQTGTIKNVNASMIFWADYESDKTIYETKNPGSDWATDNPYSMLSYNFTLEMKASLKNSDMSTFNQSDWDLLFNEKESYDKFAAVSNFDVEGYAYFEQTAGSVVTKTNAKEYMTGGYIICNYTDPSAVNYIANLRFNVRYRGYSPAYMRVRFIEQFTNTKGEIEAVNQIKFNLADGWHDNRGTDLYLYSDKLYYSVENATLTTSGKPKYTVVPIINGLDPTVTSMSDIDPLLAKDTTMTLKVSLFVEAVQPNRTEEYWDKTAEEIRLICS